MKQFLLTVVIGFFIAGAPLLMMIGALLLEN